MNYDISSSFFLKKGLLYGILQYMENVTKILQDPARVVAKNTFNISKEYHLNKLLNELSDYRLFLCSL